MNGDVKHSGETMIPIHETFQSTVQGEGFHAGTLVDFIRLQGCPVACPWCDTGYADGGQNTPRIMRSIGDLMAELKSPVVVISGGEPFIQTHLPELCSAILQSDRAVHIETSGGFWRPVPSGVWITLSPKEHINHRYPVRIWNKAHEIKLVISTGGEVEFYKEHLEDCHRRQIPVFFQPEWENRASTLPMALELIKQNPWARLSIQSHKFIGVQ
jgi:7-carboxy-7-deazaguanine synthase